VTEPRFAALLVARLPAAASIAGLDELLASQYAEAREAWPKVSVTRERYAAQLAIVLAARADEPIERAIRSMPGADLYLAAACCDRDPAAATALRTAFVPALRAALGKIGLPAATIDETVQRVLTMVLVGDGGAPQIATYTGRGTLRSWMRTIGVRTGRRLRGVEHAAAPGDDELDVLPAAVADPEVAMLRERYRDEVRDAFATAFAMLDERQRNVLRQYHIDGLTIDQLGALYRVNRATAARWVNAARQAVLATMRDRLVKQLGISRRQIDSIVRLVRSQIDVSMRTISR
jgi:RNA polymerase sigma-70 factor (ECF subfamily)